MPIYISTDGLITVDSPAEAAEFLRLRSSNPSTPAAPPPENPKTSPRPRMSKGSSWADYLAAVGNGTAREVLGIIQTARGCSIESLAESLGITIPQARGQCSGLRTRATHRGLDPDDVIVWTDRGYMPGRLLATRGVAP